MSEKSDQILELRKEIQELNDKLDKFILVSERRFDYWVLFVVGLFIIILFPFEF